jgi:hypothetical protein
VLDLGDDAVILTVTDFRVLNRNLDWELGAEASARTRLEARALARRLREIALRRRPLRA